MTLFVIVVLVVFASLLLVIDWLVMTNRLISKERDAFKQKADALVACMKPKPPVSAGDILEKKRARGIRIHKSASEFRTEFENQHNTKEQKHLRLVQEIENVASGKVDARVDTELRD